MKSLLLVTTLLFVFTNASAKTPTHPTAKVKSAPFKKAIKETDLSIIHLEAPVRLIYKYGESYLLLPEHNINGKMIKCVVSSKANLQFTKLKPTEKADGLTTFDILDQGKNSVGNLTCKSSYKNAVITPANIQKYLSMITDRQETADIKILIRDLNLNKSIKANKNTNFPKTLSEASLSDFTNDSRTKIPTHEALRIRLEAERDFLNQN